MFYNWCCLCRVVKRLWTIICRGILWIGIMGSPVFLFHCTLVVSKTSDIFILLGKVSFSHGQQSLSFVFWMERHYSTSFGVELTFSKFEFFSWYFPIADFIVSFLISESF